MTEPNSRSKRRRIAADRFGDYVSTDAYTAKDVASVNLQEKDGTGTTPSFQPQKGLRIRKTFGDRWFLGRVTNDGEMVRVPRMKQKQRLWTVEYLDGDVEDLTCDEIWEWKIGGQDLETRTEAASPTAATHAHAHASSRGPTVVGIERCRIANTPVCQHEQGTEASSELVNMVEAISASTPASTMAPGNIELSSVKNGLVVLRGNNKKSPEELTPYDKAVKELLSYPSITSDEVEMALTQVGPPYGLQMIMSVIQKSRNSDDASAQTNPTQSGAFNPRVGMRVRKVFDGRNFWGTVTKDASMYTVTSEAEDQEDQHVMMWEVTFDEGGIVDDMDWDSLFQCRPDRPIRPSSCRGRQLHCLELFSGRSIVTQEFCARKWRCESVDSDNWSNATLKTDLLEFEPENLHFVPDFIWASPPCHTYSVVAGGYHRRRPNDLDITAEARKHDFLFLKLAALIRWAKEKHPHLIIVIENPVGLLQFMPLMLEFSKEIGLHRVRVNYCAFGRDDKKATHLWTNDFGLQAVLSEYTCERKCPYHSRGKHPITVQGHHGRRYNASAIPVPLAEEVAEYVHSKCYFDRVRHKAAATPK